MKIFLDNEKTFWHNEIVFPYIEKYFPTRWKISIYTMKTFIYNENIFLHDKLFLHLGKVDQRDENFSTRCDFLQNEKYSLHDENMV